MNEKNNFRKLKKKKNVSLSFCGRRAILNRCIVSIFFCFRQDKRNYTKKMKNEY